MLRLQIDVLVGLLGLRIALCLVLQDPLIHVEDGAVFFLVPGELGLACLSCLRCRVVHLIVAIVSIGKHLGDRVSARNIALQLPLLLFFDRAFRLEESPGDEWDQGYLTRRVTSFNCHDTISLEALAKGLLLGAVQSEARVWESTTFVAHWEVGLALIHMK